MLYSFSLLYTIPLIIESLEPNSIPLIYNKLQGEERRPSPAHTVSTVSLGKRGENNRVKIQVRTEFTKGSEGWALGLRDERLVKPGKEKAGG